jgi:hypothetical protein
VEAKADPFTLEMTHLRAELATSKAQHEAVVESLRKELQQMQNQLRALTDVEQKKEIGLEMQKKQQVLKEKKKELKHVNIAEASSRANTPAESGGETRVYDPPKGVTETSNIEAVAQEICRNLPKFLKKKVI